MVDRRIRPRYVKLPSRELWVVTFSDMVSLLLTIFVMLFSMTSLEADSLKQMFGRLEGESVAAMTTPPAQPAKVYTDVSELKLALEEALAGIEPQREPTVGLEPFGIEESSRGFAISLSGDALFASGSAQLRPEARRLLAAVARTVRDTDTMVAVEGHSDNQGASARNWRLSVQRAGAVLDYLVYEGGLKPKRMALAGYGSTRPVAANTDAAGRARNRRVEIVLLKDRF
jgi:chemotaxis protein MotB